MELIIKIPDEDYKYICKIANDLKGRAVLPTDWKAIANGTVLPKGHGRLIEEPTEADILNTVGGNNDFAECIRDSVKAVFDNATTIIEADKENKKKSDELPSCNNCVHNGEWSSTGNCIKCSCFDRYEKRGNK